MAKLTALLVVLVLPLIVLECVEGEKRGKNKYRDRQKDRPEKEREEISRKIGRYDPGKKLEYFPNVCKNENSENFPGTVLDSSNIVRFRDTSIRSCEVYDTMVMCRLVLPVPSSEEIHLNAEYPGFQQFKSTIGPTGKTFTLMYECCHGYTRGDLGQGCPIKITELNLVDRLEELGLTDFLKAVNVLRLADKLKAKNYTLFVPQNGAFTLDKESKTVSDELIRKLEPAVIEVSDRIVDKSLKSFKKVFQSHLVPGIRKLNATEDEELLKTARPDGAKIRINHFYTPKKMMTANCVPIRASDVATNGIIHRIDRVLKPVTQSLMEIIISRPELQLLSNSIAASIEHTFKLFLAGNLTILAPTKSAFNDLSQSFWQKLFFGNVTVTKKFLQNHLVPNVICSHAIEGKVKIRNSNREYINVTRTKDNKIYFNHARVIQSDVMGTNGVLHIINKALVPDEDLGFTGILKKHGLTEFLTLIKSLCMRHKFEEMKDITVFAPSNEAIKQTLPREDKDGRIPNSQAYLQSVIDFHVLPTLLDTSRLNGSVQLTTLSNKKIRIQTSNDSLEKSKTVQCVPIDTMKIDYSDGQIFVIRSVMVPPEGNVMDVLGQNKAFCKFFAMIRRTSLVDLLQGEGPFTVFAPSNEAFDQLDKRVLRGYHMYSEKLENFIKHHIQKDMVCSAEIPTTKDTMNRSPEGILKLSRAILTSRDNTATNGNVIGLNTVLLKEEPFICSHHDCGDFESGDKDWDDFKCDDDGWAD